MYRVNLLLSQLEHANRFAKSNWPQDKRLALIAIDNFFELNIRNRIEHTFLYDSPNWGHPRKYSNKVRLQALKTYPDMLSFQTKIGELKKEMSDILGFIHEIRNRAYHDPSDLENELVEVGIIAGFSLVRGNAKWWILTGMTGYASGPGYENRYFSKGNSILPRTEDELEKVVDRILSYGRRKSPSRILTTIVANEVKYLRSNLKNLKEAIPELDFNNVFTAHSMVSRTRIPWLKNLPLQRLELPRFSGRVEGLSS